MKIQDACEIAFKNGYTNGYKQGLYEATQKTDLRPVVKGKWKYIDCDGGYLICSICGHMTDEMFDVCETIGKKLAKEIGGKADDIKFVLKYPFYCSKCGAYMGGEKK